MLEYAGREEAVKAMEDLCRAIRRLSKAYDAHNLNEFQPASMQAALPASIDEWEARARIALDDWRKVPTLPSRDQVLAKEMEAKYEKYKDWTFEYMYPSFFSYFNDEFRVFFTPDHDNTGEISRDVQSRNGESLVSPLGYSPCLWAAYEYVNPLKAEELFSVAKEMMDHCGFDEVKTKLRAAIEYQKK